MSMFVQLKHEAITQPLSHQFYDIKRHSVQKILQGAAYALIYLGCDKDQWSRRSKCISYEALRECDLGARDRLQVCCDK